jgi:hypothetical protein
MKKVMYGFAALALCALAACSSDDILLDSSQSGDEVVVTFNVEAPSTIQSRSFNAGDYAKQLQWAVYKTGTDEMVVDGKNAEFDKSGTTVTLRLLKNYNYDIIFWAQNADAPYSFNEEKQQIEVNYDTKDVNTFMNDENRDAFYATIKDLNVSDNTTDQSVMLRRPFAKIVVMTSKEDYEYARDNLKTRPDASTMKLNVYKTFDLINEEVADDSAEEVEFAPALYGQQLETGLTVESVTVNSVKYYGIGSAFVLTKAGGELVDCSFKYGFLNDDKALDNACDSYEFKNIPVKKNQRTVIYGEFFTKSVAYQVAIDPEFKDVRLPYAEDLTPLEQALYDGGDYQLDKDLSIDHSLSVGTEPVTIDLNEKTLTVASESASFFLEDTHVTFKNGNIVYTDRGATNACFAIMRGADVTLDGVTMNVTGSALHVEGDAASLTVKNSTIVSEGNFAIATNASSSKNWNVKIDLEESEFEALYGVYVNVPCEFTADNCVISGQKQGLLLRGGEISLVGTTVNYTAETLDTSYDSTAWRDGAFVAHAAVTIGNRNSGAYQYYTRAYIAGCTFNGPRAMYIWPNEASKEIGVFLTLGEGNTFENGVSVNTKNLTIEGGELPEGYDDITPVTVVE